MPDSDPHAGAHALRHVDPKRRRIGGAAKRPGASERDRHAGTNPNADGSADGHVA